MKSKLTNYSKSVWSGKNPDEIGYHGLKAKKFAAKEPKVERKKAKKEKEAGKILVNPKFSTLEQEMIKKSKALKLANKKKEEARIQQEEEAQQEKARKGKILYITN